MTAIVWSTALSCAVECLDREHQALVAAFNDLDAAAAAGADRATVCRYFTAFVDLVSHHVENEDRVLDASGFEGLNDHYDEDVRFVLLYREILAVFTEGEEPDLTPEVRDLVAPLLVHHILRTDAPLRAFFVRQQRPPRRSCRDYLPWFPSFVLGVPAIDQDHRLFVTLINQMKDALDLNDGAGLVTTLEAFHAHARAHCGREEAMLAHYGFPGLAEHAAEHRTLNVELAATVAAVTADPNAFDTADLLLLIKEWIVRHILFVDMRMKSHLQEHLHLPDDGTT